MRLQKTLLEMNVQLHHVLSDITGKIGMQMIRAISDGVDSPQELIKYRTDRCSKSKQEMLEALTGNYKKDTLYHNCSNYKYK